MANTMDGQNSILSVVGPLATSIPSLRLVTKALLSKKPWLYDPMTHEIPWRSDQEQEITDLVKGGDAGKGKLCFGIIRSDGQVNPNPPVRRAIEEVVKKLEAAGHEVMAWTPPSHKPIVEEGSKTWIYDGGRDFKDAFALSGEPMSDQVSFFGKLDKEFTASEVAATNVRLRELKEEYLRYWNSTQEVTSTGRVVDAVISPLAPFAAARPGMYGYYGYSTFVNVLDYTSVVVPVTNVDKSVDKKDEGYEPISEADKKAFESCKWCYWTSSGKL
jgi:amidase